MFSIGSAVHNLATFSFLLILFTVIGDAGAWDLQDQPFGFRLSITQNRNSGFTPVAHPVFSINPAGDDFLREPPYTFRAAGGAIVELTGVNPKGWVSTTSGVGYYRPESAGTFLGIYGRTETFHARTRQHQQFDLTSDAVTLRYGRHVRSKLTLGGSAKITRSDISLHTNDLKIDSSGVATEFTLGLMSSLSERWTFGALVTQAPAWSATRLRDDSRVTDHATSLLTRVRAGLGWRPTQQLSLYADAEYLRVGSQGEAMNFARGYLLTEFFPTPASVLRLGAVVDSAGKVTNNFGLGYYGFKAVKMDIGYSHNAFAELHREFGKTQYLYLILGTTF